MSYTKIGVIDYGMGNLASVSNSLHKLGYHVQVSSNMEVLDKVDVLLLPGVGAFPAAMESLNQHKLSGYLQQQAAAKRPILGICLGMQLLTSASYEHVYTQGLDLIPGEIVNFSGHGQHIGWNSLDCLLPDEEVMPSDGEAFYFNHSFHYKGPTEYQLATTNHQSPFASIIRHENIVGLQFHPEKSQLAGKILLKNLITGLTHA